MRIALAQTNPTVGDIAGNSRTILRLIAQAAGQGADLVVFPELSITGYPPKDLLLKPQFVDDNLRALQMIASRVSGLHVMVGYVDRNPSPVGRPLLNAMALLRNGKVVSRHYKTLLPTYDVFDEDRYFEPGAHEIASNVVTIDGIPCGFSICEDLWNDAREQPRRRYHQDPIADLSKAGAKLLINISASPYFADKQASRIALFQSQVKRHGIPLVYVNQVGGNDELIFDGNSVVVDGTGQVIAQAADFKEDLLVADVPTGATAGEPQRIETPSAGIESIRRALVLGLRDYVQKCGFQSVVLGLSGGIDSAVVATLAVQALGKDKVTGVAMPSRYSSQHSISDARSLASNLGIKFNLLPIKDIHEVFEATLAPVFAGKARDLTEENLQARARGALLMAMSNKFNSLLLTTGNKSEVAVGYCTLYGDMCGGLAVISDLPKVAVYDLAEHINKTAGRDVIPRNTITKAPSAELRPNQTDQDSLPPYPVLDAILNLYVEQEQGAQKIIEAGYDPATVLRVIKLVDRSEYKRRQAAPGLKVTSRAFGFGRRMPIAQGYNQEIPQHGEPAAIAPEELPKKSQ